MTSQILDEQTVGLRMSKQEIRAAALGPAVELLPLLVDLDEQTLTASADAALTLATRFEQYIRTGRTVPWPPALDPDVPVEDQCDHCYERFVGMSVGGDLPTARWCAAHAPYEHGGTEYPADVDAPKMADWERDYLTVPEPTAGPEPLADTMLATFNGWYANTADERSSDKMSTEHVRQRLAQYPADTTAAQIFADWFGSGS